MAATRARPLWNAERVGEGRGAPWRPGSERDSHPAVPGGTWRPEGCTWDSGAGSRRQGGWLSRVEARRTPIPAACSPRGLQRAHRRHRRRLGFIYPDGRARPGNRNTEAFSCFLTAWPSRRTSCGRSIHVPGPPRGSLRARPAAGTAVNPRRGAAAAGAAGQPPALCVLSAGPGSQLRQPRRRGAKGTTTFAFKREIGEIARSAGLGLCELGGCGANPVS